MAAAPPANFPDVSRLRDTARDAIGMALDSLDGKKDLVLEPDLMKPLDRIAGASFLKQHGVEKIFKLDISQKNLGGSAKRLYLVRPKIGTMKMIADQILADRSRGEARWYRIVMMPRKVYLCEMILEQEGVFGYCDLDELQVDFIPLDRDILSLETPDFFRNFFMDGDQALFHTIARSVQTIEELAGEIPNVYCIGRAAKMCHELFTKLKGDPLITAPDYSKSDIGHVFFIDRNVDYVTPLCSQVTYEGLLDDIFGINCGCVEFGPEVTGKDQPVKVLLSSKDQLFEEIRNRHFTNVFDFLKSKARELQDMSDKRHDLKSVGAMKDYVANELRSLKTEKALLSYHIGACEHILAKKTKGDFQEYLQTEHGLLEGSGMRENANYIEECIHKQSPAMHILKLLCLLSLTTDGIPARDYKTFKTQFLQSHGFEHILTFSKLKRLGLLREQELGNQSAKPLPKVAAGMAALTKSSTFKILRKKLNLIPSEDIDLKNPTDMSYVFGGAYSPLTCKLVEQCLNREGTTGLEEIVKNIPGEIYTNIRLRNAKVGKGSTTGRMGPQPSKVVLVYFLGGCTYSEITALRFLGKQTGYRFLVATTSIFSGTTLLESVMERT